MSVYMEKRASKRYDHTTPIRYGCQKVEDFVPAEMGNYSENGLYFQSALPLRPGDSISIFFENSSAEVPLIEFSKGYNAEVCFCKKIDGADASPYGIGVRFIQKISSHQSHEELKRRRGLRQQAEIYLTKHTQPFRNLPPEDNLQLIHELQVHQMELEMQNEELRRTQMELAESRDKYHELYDFAPIGYFTFDDKMQIQGVNHSGANLLGIPKSELLQMKFTQFISPGSQDDFYFHRKSLFESKKHQTCELELRKKSGATFHAKLDSVPVKDKTDTINQIRTVLTDITEERRANELVRESEKKFRQMFNQMVSAAALTETVYDKNGKPYDYRYLEVNPAFENITGKKRSLVIGKTLLKVFPATEKYWLQNLEKVALTGNPIQIENFFHELDKYFFVSAFRPRAGQIAFTFIDITERIRFERALQKAHDEMEKRVEARTAELEISNVSLTREIAERRRLSYRLLNAQEDERRRIALELHDELGQDLSVLKLQIDALKRRLSENQLDQKDHIESISALLSKTIEEVRGICHELIPSVLVDLGLAPALRWLIQSLAKHSNIEITSNILLSEDLLSAERGYGWAIDRFY